MSSLLHALVCLYRRLEQRIDAEMMSNGRENLRLLELKRQQGGIKDEIQRLRGTPRENA